MDNDTTFAPHGILQGIDLILLGKKWFRKQKKRFAPQSAFSAQ